MINVETMIGYKTAAENGVLLADLDPVERVENRAIDMVASALNMDPVLSVNIKESLDSNGANLDDIVDVADCLETFFAGVLINSSQEMSDNGNIQKWGQRILTMSENGHGTNGNGEVNRRLKSFVLAEKDIFKIEI